MLKDNHPRLLPPPPPAGWGQLRRELASALWTLASQTGVSRRGTGQLAGRRSLPF